MDTNQPETLSSLMYNMMKMDVFNNIIALTQKDGFDINEHFEYGNTALHLLIRYIYINDRDDYLYENYGDDNNNNRFYKNIGFVLAEYLLKNFTIDFSLKNSVNRTVLEQLRGIILSLTIDMEEETINKTWQLLNNKRNKMLSLLFLFKLYEIKQETENPINQSTLICFEHFSEYKEYLFADVFEMIADMNIIKVRDYIIKESIDAFTLSKNFY